MYAFLEQLQMKIIKKMYEPACRHFRNCGQAGIFQITKLPKQRPPYGVLQSRVLKLKKSQIVLGNFQCKQI